MVKQTIFLCALLLAKGMLIGCSPDHAQLAPELGEFIAQLKAEGVDGNLTIRRPSNADIDYIAEYSIAKYASTRVISIFKCKDADTAAFNLAQALKNKKLSGQARNGAYLMAATFYPPDEEAVTKIKAIFMQQHFAK